MKNAETLEIAIVVLNEEKNIAKCIKSIGNFPRDRVTVWDGGSTDNTVKIAQDLGINVKSLPGTSLAKRRGISIDESKADFIMFLDADQNLIVDAEAVVKKYFVDPKLAGIQFSVHPAKESTGYWAKAFGYRWQMITGTPGPRMVLGTPTIFRNSVAKVIKYDPDVSGSTDDTNVCYRMRMAGYKLLAIEENAEERVRATFKATIRKAHWYGLGDSEFVKNFQPTPYGHVYHVLIRNFITIPAKVLFTKPIYFPFFFIFGLSRLVGFLTGMLTPKLDLTATKS